MGKTYSFDFSKQQLTGTTVIGVYEGHKVTVSQMLSVITSYIKFIRDNFDVSDNNKYSIALAVLKIMKLRLNNNNNLKKPNAEQLKCLVDVFHEIADLQARSEVTKQANEKRAALSKAIIDFAENWDRRK